MSMFKCTQELSVLYMPGGLKAAAGVAHLFGQGVQNPPGMVDMVIGGGRRDRHVVGSGPGGCGVRGTVFRGWLHLPSPGSVLRRLTARFARVVGLLGLGANRVLRLFPNSSLI